MLLPITTQRELGRDAVTRRLTFKHVQSGLQTTLDQYSDNVSWASEINKNLTGLGKGHANPVGQLSEYMHSYELCSITKVFVATLLSCLRDWSEKKQQFDDVTARSVSGLSLILDFGRNLIYHDFITSLLTALETASEAYDDGDCLNLHTQLKNCYRKQPELLYKVVEYISEGRILRA